MNTIQRAVLFAAKKHASQLRKGTNTPYIVHPLGVMESLMFADASENAIVAGILHDTLEDTNTTYEELVKNFGARVADIVVGASESDKSQPWQIRKEHTITALRRCNDMDVLAVVFADKLNNISSIYRDWQHIGDDVWKRFNCDCDSQMWYYGEICKIARERHESVSEPARTMMREYWYEYDSFVHAMERWARLNGCGDDREYTPEEEAYFSIMAIEHAAEIRKECPTLPLTPLEEYMKYSKQLGDEKTSDTDANKIAIKMQQLKAKFTEHDWDTLIYSSPVFMRAMISAQKNKFLNKK